MLKELFEALSAQAVKAAKPDVVELPDNEYGIRQIDGTLMRYDHWRRRDSKASDLSAIIASAFISNVEDVEIWYSRAGVVFVADLHSCNNRVTLNLEYSPQLLWLQAQEAKPSELSQAALILRLRTMFAAAVPNIAETVLAFRSLVTTGNSIVQPGKVSVGRTIASESAPTIPEYLTLTVPIWKSGFEAFGSIKCVVEPNPTGGTFSIIPLTGAIEEAIQQGEEAIGAVLAGKTGDVPIYYGQP